MSDRLRVVALTAGLNVPSARYRIGQYVGALADLGIAVDWRPAPIAKYPPECRWIRPLWLAGTTVARVPGVIASRSAEFTILGRELVSTLKTLENWTGRPRALDVDDAVWLTQRFDSTARIARSVDVVFAGNTFVADWFSKYCDDIVIVPTAVDVERFIPAEIRSEDSLIFGWSGTSGNLSTLDAIWPSLAHVAERYDELVVRIVCDSRPQVPEVLRKRLQYIRWAPDNEVRTIQEMDVGLMPLSNDDWSRGKCSYKMLLYMACGVPVVVSPVGMNVEILAQGEVGFGPATTDEWTDALLALAADATMRRRMGALGRQLVEDSYGLHSVAKILAGAIRRVAGAGATS